jgi:HPt (histidine-containing phosphotransfer) domain-containing protein/HAMP domain-containing protein
MTVPSTIPRARTGKVFLSLGLKLTVPVLLLVLATAGGVYWGLIRQERVSLLKSKEAAADMVVKLTAASIMPAVVFNDETETKRSIDDLARNPEVTDVELWAAPTGGEAPTKPLASFHRGAPSLLGGANPQPGQRIVTDEAVHVTEGIVDPTGKPTAVIAVRFSTDRERAALTRLARQSLYGALAVALALAGAILLTISRVAVVPLRRLQRAARHLAQGDRRGDELGDTRGTDDEVRQLAITFKEMADAVTDREDKLAVRNAELKLILDSVQQGFLTAERDGVLRAARSAIIDTWLPGLPSHATFWDLVERIDPRARAWTEAGWEQLLEGVLPLEVCCEQLPRQLSREGRHFAFAYHPVMRGDVLDQVVIVISDVTAEIERERSEAEQHEFSVLVDQFVRDRRAFLDFWNEAAHLVQRILDPGASSATGLKRDLHTLKGSSRFYGLTRLAGVMHRFEDALLERGGDTLMDSERLQLSDLWQGLTRRIEPLMRGAMAFVEISEDEYAGLSEAIKTRKPYPTLQNLLAGLRNEPTSRRLERAKEMIIAACRKLGKPTPIVNVEHNDLRLPSGPWAPFWSVMPHVLHNAADHGVEPAADRVAAGKPEATTLWLSTAAESGELVVRVKDDGRGIDWERIRALAMERGLPCSSRADLEAALFSEGVSTRQAATELSGRGVGLAAVQGVVSALNGRIELDSSPSEGTTWTFRFPLGSAESALRLP